VTFRAGDEARVGLNVCDGWEADVEGLRLQSPLCAQRSRPERRHRSPKADIPTTYPDGPALPAPARRRAGAVRRHAGSTWGRSPKLTPRQQAEARRRRAEGTTLKELPKSYGVGVATISRLRA